MKKRLSSLWTYFYKKVFPSIWITGFGLGTVALWFGIFKDNKGQPPPPDIKWTFLLAWIVGTVFLLWYSRRLKSVWLEGDRLIVTDYQSEENIPLQQIKEVIETRLWNPKLIKIRFRRPTRWGDQIVFIAPMSLKITLVNHPIVIELRERASKATKKIM